MTALEKFKDFSTRYYFAYIVFFVVVICVPGVAAMELRRRKRKQQARKDTFIDTTADTKSWGISWWEVDESKLPASSISPLDAAEKGALAIATQPIANGLELKKQQQRKLQRFVLRTLLPGKLTETFCDVCNKINCIVQLFESSK